METRNFAVAREITVTTNSNFSAFFLRKESFMTSDTDLKQFEYKIHIFFT